MAQNPEKNGGKPSPLKNRKVRVDAYPREVDDPKQTQRHEEYAKRVKANVKSDGEKAIDAAAEAGSDEQIKAARKAMRDAQGAIDPNQIDYVDVEVSGEVDDDDIKEDLSFFPGEEKSDDDADDDS